MLQRTLQIIINFMLLTTCPPKATIIQKVQQPLGNFLSPDLLLLYTAPTLRNLCNDSPLMIITCQTTRTILGFTQKSIYYMLELV